MIIVSQDRKALINFNNVVGIQVIDKRLEAKCIDCNYKITLGGYATEERANEVLQEIINKYSNYLQLNGGPAIMKGDIDIQPNIFNIPKVYYMPNE